MKHKHLYNRTRYPLAFGILLSTLFSIILTSCSKEPVPGENEFRDFRDRNIYKTVWMNGHIWMAENLAFLPQVDSAFVESDTVARYYVYGYEEPKLSIAKQTTNYYIYGVLYNWTAAQSACPEGWHLPSDEEWKGLETSLGMTREDADQLGHRETGALADKLKSTSNWFDNANGHDTEGFDLKPGSRKAAHYGEYLNIGKEAYLWTSTPDTASSAFLRFILSDDIGVSRSTGSRSNGLSIRCVKNEI